MKSPYTSNSVHPKTLKVYDRLTKNLHGLTWHSGVHDFSFLFCLFVGLKIRFPNFSVYAKGFEKCAYLHCFFIHVNDLDTLNCHNSSRLNQLQSLPCPNHQKNYQRAHCARKKTNLFYDWLSRWNQHCEHAERQITPYPIPESKSCRPVNGNRMFRQKEFETFRQVFHVETSRIVLVLF